MSTTTGTINNNILGMDMINNRHNKGNQNKMSENLEKNKKWGK
jgi:hypothetical protein